MTMFPLQGRKALVTGSTRGIGRAIARTLAAAGAEVFLHGIRRNAVADEAVAEAGASAQFVAGDLGAAGGGRALAEEVLRRSGGVDIVVLNASVQIRRNWREISPEDFAGQMRVNVEASLEILQGLVPSMQAKKWGRILAVGSVQQAVPHPDMLVYSASKSAQMNMVLSLAKQFAPDGVTINNLAPGVILTDRNTDALADPAYAETVKASIPAGFFGSPGDCAGAALLLCSEAGRYITGQNLYVDGGMSL